MQIQIILQLRKNLEILKSEFHDDVQTIPKSFESTPIVVSNNIRIKIS